MANWSKAMQSACQSLMKIPVITYISVLQFDGYIEDISVDILEKIFSRSKIG